MEAGDLAEAQAVLWALSAAGRGVPDNFMFLKNGCWAFQSVSCRTSETKGNFLMHNVKESLKNSVT